MKRLYVLAVVLALLSAPAEAFSVKAGLKKTGHVAKVVGKKIGTFGLYALAAFAAIELCSHGGCN
jgi:hypothetical protein